MKCIIVYYSNTHNNELLAYALQKRLSCDILKIEETSKRTGLTIIIDLLFNRKPKLKDHGVSLESYNVFIFVAPIWASKIASPLRSFLLNEKQHIQSYSFISLCGGIKGQVDKIQKELKTILQHDPKLVTELWIDDLLTADKKNTVKYTSSYRVLPEDLEKFKEKIDEFVSSVIVQPHLTHDELR
jgi:flavodoxin